MKTAQTKYLYPLLFLFLLITNLTSAQIAIPELKSRVTDQTRTLTSRDIASLEAKLAALEKSKGSQLFIAIVYTTGEETIEQYGIRMAEQWKAGRKDVDDGVILIIAKEDRKLRIEVGYGLEGAIPDAMAKQIIEERIVPRFRSSDFFGGINAGVDALIALIQGEDLPPAQGKSRQQIQKEQEEKVGKAILLLFAAFFLNIIMYSAIKNSFLRIGLSVGLAAVIGLFLSSWIVLLIALVFTLTIQFKIFSLSNPTSGYTSANDPYGRRAGGGWYGGGSSGGFGGGGGGFGGGGGGGFGGGGASGGW
ncbi:TPM domain-containing protein [bacterium SCSIO 12741]|nr:TPM domain-containing protein [bacterium SCSIO 12741]